MCLYRIYKENMNGILIVDVLSDCSWTSMPIGIFFDLHLHLIAVILSSNRVPIELIVEAFPLLSRVTIVISIDCMKLLYFVHVVLD